VHPWLPVAQTTKFEMAINHRTAKPPSLAVPNTRLAILAPRSVTASLQRPKKYNI
jgi:hypothetical protein